MPINQFVRLPTDGIGKRMRTYERTIDANVVQESVVVINRNLGRIIAGKYRISTPIMAGGVTDPYNWFTIWNPSASAKLIAVKMLFLMTWAVGAATYISMQFCRISGTAPSGGSILTPMKKDNVLDGTATAVIRHTGVTIGTLNAIFNTILTAGAAAQNPYLGQQCSFEPGEEIILRETEGVLVRSVGAGDVDQRHVVIIEFDEFTGIVRT